MRPTLTLVVDRRATRHPLAAAVGAAVSAGVDRIQLRDRELEGGAWLRFAREIASAARGARPEVEIVVNRRVDIALAIEADGVHLGFDAMAVADARALLGESALIGVSTHSGEDVRAAAGSGADYVHLAPLFDPVSKPAERPALGPEALGDCVDQGVAVIAQGGLEAARVREVVAVGAAGIAVTGPVLLADDPGEAARALRAALDGARQAGASDSPLHENTPRARD